MLYIYTKISRSKLDIMLHEVLP